jgi:uncharacterized protein (DUF849 family)
MIQATLNGPYDKDRHPRLPVSRVELAEDVAACARAGACHFHVHVRDAAGAETLDPLVVNEVVSRIRGDLDVAIGLTTGAWIEPDLHRRVAQVQGWRGVDYATVNVSEEGFARVMRAMLETGTAVDAGVFTVDDVEPLARSGLLPHVLRVSVEPLEEAAEVLAAVKDIHHALDDAGSTAPRLQHGDGDAAWLMVHDALRRGLDTRVGFEDTVRLPDGSVAPDNAALVAAAIQLAASFGTAQSEW